MQLTTYEFGGMRAPHMLITAGVHGDEFEPIVAAHELIALFERDDPEVASLRGRVTLVPLVNVAAFMRGQRTADDELDLARVCPGDPSGSITQQTAAALSTLIRQADYYIDLHSGGSQSMVFPLAGYTLHRDRSILETQRRMARAFNLPVVWGTSGELDGRSLSVARDAGVPAIYCEYLGGGQCSAKGVADYVSGCLGVMAALGMIDSRNVPSCVQHVVEDPRPQSGHMQICNPAPITGVFEPAVQLGDAVQTGEFLGHVIEPTSGDRHAISAQQTGLVIVLRTFPRVLAGDSLGVVMEDPGRP